MSIRLNQALRLNEELTRRVVELQAKLRRAEAELKITTAERNALLKKQEKGVGKRGDSND